MEHILIGRNLLLKIDHIMSANLSVVDKDGKDCIKIKVSDGTEWTVWANLEYSRQTLKSIPKINDQFDLLENIREVVLKNRVGRESNVSIEIKEILNQV